MRDLHRQGRHEGDADGTAGDATNHAPNRLAVRRPVPTRLEVRHLAARRLSVLAAVVGLLGACGEDTGFGPEISSDIEAFVALANEHRVSVGCEPLEWSRDVARVAQAHSDDMVVRDFFSHTNPDGASPFDRLREADIGYSRAAENIAYGYTSARAVLDGWLSSPGHRANLENCSLTRHGVGLTDWHWTHLFVTP